MKRIRKIVMLLCVLSVLFSVAGCGKKEESDDGYSKEELASLADSIAKDVEYLSDMSDEALESQIQTYEEQGSAIENSQILAGGLRQLKEARQESGKYEGIYKDSEGNVKYTYSETSNSILVTVTAKFTKRDVNVSYTISTKDGTPSISQILYEPKYTLAEKMKKAGMNTVIGIMIVIVMLVFLSLIISLFAYVNKFERYLTHRKQAKIIEGDGAGDVIIDNGVTGASDTAEEEAEEIDDTELVAVITAAIMASKTVSADGFVVRSIKRVPNSKWNRM